MITKISDNYISNRAWFRDVLKGQLIFMQEISYLICEYERSFVCIGQ